MNSDKHKSTHPAERFPAICNGSYVHMFMVIQSCSQNKNISALKGSFYKDMIKY